ncbi:ribosome biogenesis GTPase Der [Saccharicrinis sp. FJH2]|uniref:ribosome biogenesis GTPase Der n=1 Tax=unclassified Saccharicrinis TaxID=2646859 RepID=UPI0035D479EE
MSIVAIVGRPNVGKSTLFNRLTESKRAIVDETAGVTRDRHYGKSLWNGKDFSVVDTGGYVVNSDDVFEEQIRKQVLIAIAEADVIIMLVDVTTGITDMDSAVAEILRKTEKKVILVVNKVDNNMLINDAYEFYNLGLGDYFMISSMNGSGTGELMDEIAANLTEDTTEVEEELPRIAVVGRPNVGKSSIINAFIGEERNIVTEVAGTTRDSINTRFNKFGHDFILIDTAGLRKKGKVSEDLEFYSVLRTIRSIEYSDVCVLMLDATRGVEAQDMNIYSIINKNRKGVVVCVNKWDLIEKDTHTAKEFERDVRERFAPFTDFPILFTSVPDKQRILKVLEMAMKVYENKTRKVPTSKLNEVMLEAIENYHPPAVKGKFIKIKFVTQLPSTTPSFAFFCNLPQYVKEPYRRYLENQIRKNWDFSGVPIRVFMRKK